MRNKINAVLAQEATLLERAEKQMKFPFLMDTYYALMDTGMNIIKGDLFNFLDKLYERQVRLGIFEQLVEEGRITDGNVHRFYENQVRDAESEFEDMKALLLTDSSEESRVLYENLDAEILECDLFKKDFEWLFKRMNDYERYLERQSA